MKMKALLDSGANAIYIDKAYAQKMKLPLTLLADPIPVYNVDGTRNAAGSITHCAEIIIQFQEHCESYSRSDRFGKESNDSRLHVAFA
jgi:predicted aspartyl protease